MSEPKILMENRHLIDLIKTIPIFEPFTEQELNNLLKMSKITQYRTGECIIKEGTSDTWVYFIISGQVSITKKGKKVALLQRKGDLFGEMGAINSSFRSASAHAAVKTVCLATDIFYSKTLSGNDKTAFGYVLYRIFSEILAHRLRITTNALLKAQGKINLKFW